MIPLLKAGLSPGDGCPVGRDTTCADESARCFCLFPFDRFGKICSEGLSAFSNSQIPTQATTTTREPAFHSSSPVILQQLVQVIMIMGPHSRFSVEVSDGSELTIQLLQRRFQRFSDDWLRRVLNALRNWQIWASKHCPPLLFGTPPRISLVSTSSLSTNVVPQWPEASGHNWIGSDVGGAFLTDSLLLASFRLHAVAHLPTPAAEMPPGVFLAITSLSSTTQGSVAFFRWAWDASGYSLFALATPSPINCSAFQRTVHPREVSLG